MLLTTPVLRAYLVMDIYQKTNTNGIDLHVSTMNCKELTVVDNYGNSKLTADFIFSKIGSESIYNFTTVRNDSLSSLGVTSIIDFEKTSESMHPYLNIQN